MTNLHSFCNTARWSKSREYTPATSRTTLSPAILDVFLVISHIRTISPNKVKQFLARNLITWLNSLRHRSFYQSESFLYPRFWWNCRLENGFRQRTILTTASERISWLSGWRCKWIFELLSMKSHIELSWHMYFVLPHSSFCRWVHFKYSAAAFKLVDTFQSCGLVLHTLLGFENVVRLLVNCYFKDTHMCSDSRENWIRFIVFCIFHCTLICMNLYFSIFRSCKPR